MKPPKFLRKILAVTLAVFGLVTFFIVKNNYTELKQEKVKLTNEMANLKDHLRWVSLSQADVVLNEMLSNDHDGYAPYAGSVSDVLIPSLRGAYQNGADPAEISLRLNKLMEWYDRQDTSHARQLKDNGWFEDSVERFRRQIGG